MNACWGRIITRGMGRNMGGYRGLKGLFIDTQIIIVIVCLTEIVYQYKAGPLKCQSFELFQAPIQLEMTRKRPGLIRTLERD